MLYKFKPELEKIQQEIADVTKLAIVIVDKDEKYITKKQNYSEFCSIFRKNKTLKDLCEKCDVKALNRSFCTSSPYIYRCHSGLIDMAIPIVLDGEYLGAILIGQAILMDNETFGIENILDKNMGKNISNTMNDKAIRESYEKLQKFSYSELNSIANIVYYTSFYIVENIKSKKWHNHKIDNNLENIELSISPVGPAITYIKNNLNKNISLDTAASLCSLSVSHFSKVFKKEVGKNFKEYLNGKRIEKAKYLLKSTNNTIYNIGYSLGIEDTSYFTKMFKKYVKVTPKKYRELFEEKNKTMY
jgi:ligand-binding sensor protein/AraC-like DNA-binding protein